MNYHSHYSKLINRAKSRIIEGYIEMHHIIPRCMGGTDEPSNLVPLTAEEHYVAHLLLVKMYPNNPKLIYAANMMCNRNNKSYGWVKRKFAEQIKIQNKNQIVTDEQRKKMSDSGRGKSKNAEWKSKIGQAHLKQLEYLGQIYKGYDDLKNQTGVSAHLYKKYYLNGIDPTPFIGNNTYAITEWIQENKPKNVQGKIWINNGDTSRYIDANDTIPTGWIKGRGKLKRKQK